MAGSGSTRHHLLQWTVSLVLITWAVKAQDSNLTCSDFQTSGIFQDNELQVQFLLFTFQNQNCGHFINLSKPESIKDSPFNSSRATKILIHGFRALGTKPSWIDDMVDALLGAVDANVVAVDWVSGSTAKYNQAVENIPRLSNKVAELINRLLELGVTEESLHMIGISLGAHAAGLVGQMFGGRIGHITGLDPAGYKFKKAGPEERLDPRDAIFVEAIHTDTDSFGISIPVGHVDYFINGGRDQPGCPSVRHLYGFVICDHMRSVTIYITALRGICSFTGFPCPNYKEFLSGQCVNCSVSSPLACPRIAREEILANPRTQIISQEAQVFLMTTSKDPFCAHHMLLVFSLTEPRDSTITIEIELKSETSSSKAKVSIPNGHVEGRTVLAHDVPLCELQTAVLRYPGSIIRFWKGKTEISGTFCVSEMPLKDRNELFCLPNTITLTGNSRHSFNLEADGRLGCHNPTLAKKSNTQTNSPPTGPTNEILTTTQVSNPPI
ncbi:phospholipase A1 member A isoform X2 [Xenopus laevis]|uniref:Phospholipase A1 member A n=1 Tax=Xenopus laevis TaxID=8355 RepID=A0A8J1M6L1_XENLA|nr:phospholipase A1 member A isoform X2 [Xenopus laevis]